MHDDIRTAAAIWLGLNVAFRKSRANVSDCLLNLGLDLSYACRLNRG